MDEAELLFTELLNCNRSELYLDRDHILDKEDSRFVAAALKRRIRGEPIQYILGKTEFMGLEFRVTPNVLIPRPETETLVETTIRLGQRSKVKGQRISILDVGTGSGCIAISLAKFLPNAKITAIDISPEALKLTRDNARLNNVEDKIIFIHSDLFSSDELRATSYELICCNPPYIPSSQIEKLQPEVQYEPRLALDGGEDGLDFYRQIIPEAAKYLKKDGLLVMEMGFGQCQSIKELIALSGSFEIIEVVRDYAGIERVIIARRQGIAEPRGTLRGTHAETKAGFRVSSASSSA